MKKNYGLIAAVVIILFSVYVYINTLTLTSTANAALGPAFMPKMVSVILFILGWLDLFEELKKKKDGENEEEDGPAEGAMLAEDVAEGCPTGKASVGGVPTTSLARLRTLLVTRVDVFSAILLLGYVFSIKRLGFLIASAIYMLLQMLLLTVNTKRNYILLIALTIAVPSIIYFGFVKIFYLMLPPGILG